MSRYVAIHGWDITEKEWVELLVDSTTHRLHVDTTLPATAHAIHNVTMTSANTEYSQALAGHTKKFLIRCRGNCDIKVAFSATESGTKYVTVLAGMSYSEDLIAPVSLTLYFQCATAGQVAEIVGWN